MRRLGVILAVLAAAALPSSALAGAIDLRIAYKASESAPVRLLTLHCGDVHGTVPRPAAACRKLFALGPDGLAPTPRGQRACSQIYGGPQTALVTGLFYGHRVWTRFSRVDGCAIARWRKVAFLFPAPD